MIAIFGEGKKQCMVLAVNVRQSLKGKTKNYTLVWIERVADKNYQGATKIYVI